MVQEHKKSKIKIFPRPILGTVEETITYNEPGRVKCQASYWPARFYHSDCQETVLPDEPVNVVGIEGMTMLVIPISVMAQATNF